MWDGFDTVSGERALDGDSFMHETKELEFDASRKIEHMSHGGVIREFLDSLGSGSKPQTDCTDNITSVAMVLGAIESVERGRRVQISIP